MKQERDWRRRLIYSLAAVILLSITIVKEASAFDDPSVVEAQKVFKQYTDLERAYDPGQAELYSAQATIKDTRIYQDGPSKVLTWNGDSFKKIIQAQMPVAKLRGEQYVYSQVTYTKEGNNVRIKCTRSLPQKKFSGPLELLVAAGTKGGWKIIEEICQSQP